MKPFEYLIKCIKKNKKNNSVFENECYEII